MIIIPWLLGETWDKDSGEGVKDIKGRIVKGRFYCVSIKHSYFSPQLLEC